MTEISSIQKSTSIAWRSLRRNRLQTILTMVGMTIGVATVLTMIGLGAGAQSAIQDQVRAAGMNVIVVTSGNYKMQQQWTSQGEAEEPAAYRPEHDKAHIQTMELRSLPRPQFYLHYVWQPGTNPTMGLAQRGENAAGLGASDKLTLADADAVTKLQGVQYVSAGVAENELVTAGDRTWFTRLHGEGADLPRIRRSWIFAKGKFFSESDIDQAKPVIVLGSIVSEKLFGKTDPIGKEVLFHKATFKVIGVVGSGSWMVPAAPGDDQFDAVYIPVTTGQHILQRKSLATITISTASTGEVNRVTKAIMVLLRERHQIAPNAAEDFIVSSQARKSLAKGGMRTDIARAVTGNVNNLDKVTLEQLGKTLDRASRTMTALLASIASVSLIVGGIGIMNIMLLSVTERTREIGIRRAVGARSSEVMQQFLMEAVTLSLTGGLLGIVMGIMLSWIITRMIQWSTSISILAVVLSFGISAAVGILFGYYPAREASRVSPMTSLRYE
ncbi:MAG: ABC transporter permease [Edaphobacter sp.]|uniref:ABC transporter permease n=1 Tax=Edaphobacter sp. TaxID=1934404 RepID=UPI00238CD4A1|nr:ABC transporter permease [Edaphobacter sp.]MDE1175316.1 ABC transporter permease [Edaphobacter sp.]